MSCLGRFVAMTQRLEWRPVRGPRHPLKGPAGLPPARETAASAGVAVLPGARITCLSLFARSQRARGMMVVRMGCWAAARQNHGRCGGATGACGVVMGVNLGQCSLLYDNV